MARAAGFIAAMAEGREALNMPSLLRGGFSWPTIDFIQLHGIKETGFKYHYISKVKSKDVFKSVISEPASLIKIKNGWLVTGNCQPVTAEGNPLHTRYSSDFDEKVFIRRAQHKRREVSRLDGHVFVLSTLFPNNYSHWISQVCVAALMFLEQIRREKIASFKFVVPAGASVAKWKMDALAAVGIQADRVVEMPTSFVQCESLYFASVCYPQNSHTAAVSTPFTAELSQALHKTTTRSELRRIFIDRSAARARPLRNREKIYESFRNKGYSVLRMENYSLLEQLDIFSSATVIVGEHGAGLTNILASRGAHVFELFPDRFGNMAYPALSNPGGNYFTRIIGSEIMNGSWTLDIEWVHDQIDARLDSKIT
jgi:capsular polysaccharide biosynthesis protein